MFLYVLTNKSREATTTCVGVEPILSVETNPEDIAKNEFEQMLKENIKSLFVPFT